MKTIILTLGFAVLFTVFSSDVKAKNNQWWQRPKLLPQKSGTVLKKKDDKALPTVSTFVGECYEAPTGGDGVDLAFNYVYFEVDHYHPAGASPWQSRVGHGLRIWGAIKNANAPDIPIPGRQRIETLYDIRTTFDDAYHKTYKLCALTNPEVGRQDRYLHEFSIGINDYNLEELKFVIDPNNDYVETNEANNIIHCTSFRYETDPATSLEPITETLTDTAGYEGECVVRVRSNGPL